MTLRNEAPQYPISTAAERIVGGGLRRVFARASRRGGVGYRILARAGVDVDTLD